jgi:hypothetical protein
MSASSPSPPELQNQTAVRPQTNRPTTNRRASPLLWTLFSLCAVITIGFFFIPAFVIRPFTHQAPRPLLVAMALRQRAPLATLIAGLASLVLALALWRTVGLWRKALLVLTMIVIAFSTVMARQNYFEWMFHPIAGAQFVTPAQSKLDAKEMILAVRLGDDARAYPISQMAYHHILNDVVGGVPIGVTY